ncbi:MAG: hypothetical protein ABIK15_13400 [Pseudomonadota bacterium]
MFNIKIQKADMRSIGFIYIVFCLSIGLSGCGGGGSDGSSVAQNPETDTGQSQEAVSNTWEKVELRRLQASGMLIPNVQAVFDGESTIHVAYFTDSLNTVSGFTIRHASFSVQDMAAGSNREIIDIDNCRTLGLTLGTSQLPIVSYQGGRIRECGSEQQSDVMMSMGSGNNWTEAVAGIGFVERNPVFQDGLAGKRVSVASDSSGNIHLAYQFFYEGCDAMNFNYPDLLYVRKSGSDPEADSDEEMVEGNIYNANGTASAQNNVGANAGIIIDSEDDPAVFYYADLTPNSSGMSQKGLRVARKKGGIWTHEWIETGIRVGDISAGMDPDGNLAVAYHVESEYRDSLGSHDKLLKYAVRNHSGWSRMIVDESVQCGRYCSLSFNAEGYPAIAYYATQNHSGSTSLQDLAFAEYTGSAWETETVSAEGDIGHYNTLWFDRNGTAYICSYSETTNTIFLFYR